MPALGEQFRRHFPGLVPIESVLWRVWLEDHEQDYDRFEYNVHVGQGINIAPRSLEDTPELQEKIRKQFQQATQKKIDVVGFQGPAMTIFEVEERPGTRALGQLLTYRELLHTQRPPTAPTTLGLVARRLGTDMRAVFERSEVTIWLVIPPTPR